MVARITRVRWHVTALLRAPVVSRTAGAQQTAESAGASRCSPSRSTARTLIDYLGESVANLIRSRLEASVAGARVVDAAPLVASPERGCRPGRVGGRSLRSISRVDVGAAFIISGSITELAGSYSLDVRVTSAAPAQPGQTLVVTADREDELLGNGCQRRGRPGA